MRVSRDYTLYFNSCVSIFHYKLKHGFSLPKQTGMRGESSLQAQSGDPHELWLF